MLDIFNEKAFSTTSLTDAVNLLKYRPSRIEQLGLFRESGVATLTVAIEQKGDILSRIEPSARGSGGEAKGTAKRVIRDLRTRHFLVPWSVMADEVQGVRAFGEETKVETIQELVAEKMASNLQNFALEEEAQRLGVITGTVTFADSSTESMFTAFGVTEEAEVGFDLAAATPVDGILRKRCTSVIRAMRKRLGAVPFTKVHAFVGDNFFDKLLQHKEVRDTYKGWGDAQILRDSYVGPNRATNPMFEFGGIVFENYGEIDGEGVGISTEACRFFPLGVDNLFRTYYAPADYIETVNTKGKRLYSKQERMDFDRGISGEIQMNTLNLCTRPGVLMGARSGA